jgi:hypothetical protein
MTTKLLFMKQSFLLLSFLPTFGLMSITKLRYLFVACLLFSTILVTGNKYELQFKTPRSAPLLFPDGLRSPSSGTIEFWVYVESGYTGNQSLFCDRDPNPSLTIEMTSEGIIHYSVNDGTDLATISSSSAYLNQWVHIAVSWDGTTDKLIVNGVEEASMTQGSPQNIGPWIFNPRGNLNGKLDDFRVWESARNASDISASRVKELTTYTGMRACYKMDETSGTQLTDATGNGYHAEIKNMGMYFDGDSWNHYVQIPYSAKFQPVTTQALTIEAWVCPTGSRYDQKIVSSGYYNGSYYGFFLFLYYNGGDNYHLVFEVRQNGGRQFAEVSGTNLLKLGQWRHLAMTWDRTNGIRGYVNGELIASNAAATGEYSMPGGVYPDVFLGSVDISSDQRYDGYLDELRFWNYARSQSDLANNMNQEIDPSTSGLVGYYRMDTNAPALYDYSEPAANRVNGSLHEAYATGGAFTGTTRVQNNSGIYYVNTAATGTNDGLSWGNAFTSLQTATWAATSGEKIWVAKGTYKPTTGTDRSVSFQMKNGVEIYGGFAGTEDPETFNLADRDFETNKSILSGDIGTVGNTIDNSFHVIFNKAGLNNSAILDGFSIMYGRASGSAPNDCGGGMYNLSASPTITHVVISSNYAYYYGGGIFNESCSPTIANAVFLYNSNYQYGGGLANYGASPTITNAVFSSNSAYLGGGIMNYGSSATLNNCILWDNSILSGGNGKQIYGNSTLNNSCYGYGDKDVAGSLSTNSCIITDPKFVNAASGNFRLMANSPCVNTGKNSYNSITYDMDGEDRIINGVIDMGAYEYQGVVNTWTGDESSAWNTPANWCLGSVPEPETDVTIPDVANDPIISDATTADCHNLTVTGSLTIQSSASGTGSLIVSGTPTGNLTAQRWMTAGAWHIVSSPLSGQTIAGFLTSNENIATNGTDRGMMNYNPAGNSWNTYFTNATGGNLETGKGFSMRVGATDAAVTFTGAIQTGALSATSLTAEKWNCVGNPYTSAIGITTGSAASANFLTVNSANLADSYGAIYVWNKPDASNGNTGSYTVITNTAPDFNDVQQGQAFMVNLKTGVTSVSFTSAMQIHNTALALKSAKVVWPVIKLKATVGQQVSSTIVAFNSGMTKGLDPTYDAGLLKGASDLIVYSKLVKDNGIPFAVQALPDNDYSNMIVPIGLDFKTGGEVVFSAEMSNLSPDCKVILEDKLTRTFTDLSKDVYKVTIAAKSVISDRFNLHTSYQTTGTSPLLSSGAYSLKAYPADGQILIIGDVASGAKASLFDVNGRNLGTFNLQEGNRNSISSAGLAPGVYLLNVIETNKRFNTRIVIY